MSKVAVTVACLGFAYCGFLFGLGEGFKLGKETAIAEMERQAATRQ